MASQDMNRSPSEVRMRLVGVVAAAAVVFSVSVALPAAADTAAPDPGTVVPQEPSATSDPTATPAPDESPSAIPAPEAEPGSTAAPSPTDVPRSPRSIDSTPTSPDAEHDAEPDAEHDAGPDAGPDAAKTAISAQSPPGGWVGGADSYVTAAAISARAYPGGAEVAYVVSASDTAEGVTAAAAAAAQNGPLLLTAPSALSAATDTELRRLAPARIVIVGASITAAVEASLRQLASHVVRYAGADTYATSRALVDGEFERADVVYVTTGANGPIAIPAAAAAGAVDAPVIIVNGAAATVDGPTQSLIDTLAPRRIVIVGTTAFVSAGIESALRSGGRTVTRAGAADPNASAAAVSKLSHASASRAILVSGTATAHGIAAAAWAGAAGVPLLLTGKECIADSAATELTRLGASNRTLIGTTANLGAAVVAGRSCTAERTRLQGVLTTKLNTVIAKYPGTYAVTVREIDGLGQTVAIRGGNRYEPASTIKVFNAYAVLKRVQSGSLKLATRLPSKYSINSCVTLIIVISDNPCHTDLIKKIGAQTLSTQFYKEGYTGTYYSGTKTGGVKHGAKRSTTNDLSTFLYRLEKGQLLNATYTNKLRNLMHAQIWRTRISAGLPPEAWQASKTGELWVSSGMTQSDIAIVRGPTKRYVIAVLGSKGATKSAIKAISRAVYQHFNGSFKTTVIYPAQQMETTTKLKFRAGPGTGARVISTLAKGRGVEVISSSRKWVRVKVGGKTGWVHFDYLRNRGVYAK